MRPIPTVSVVMPTFNQCWFLERALDSVRCQTFSDFELIIINDGSTDDTLDVARRWKAAHPEVPTAIRTIPNGGAGNAINTGIEAASGSYLTWVSSDNEMRPIWLERLVAACRMPGVGAAYGGFYWILARTRAEALDRNRWTNRRYHHTPWAPDKQIQSNDCFYGPALLIERSVWLATDGHQGRISHDLNHWLQVEEVCAERGLVITSVDECLCDYLAHDERATIRKAAEYDAPEIIAAAKVRRGLVPA